jgi:cell division protein FtsQ
MSGAPTTRTMRPRGASTGAGDDRPTVTVFDSRRARRGAGGSGRDGSRRRPRMLALVIAFVVLCAAVAWAVLVSPLLAVSKVEVVGNHQLSAVQVEQAAHVPIGRPLARLDLASIVSRVDHMPAVESVVVSRSYPHTVRIAIVERIPVATTRGGDGRWHLVDGGGYDFATSTSQPAGLPVISGTAAIPGVGTRLLQACVSVAASLPRSVRLAVVTMGATSPFAVTLHLAHGVTVRWGDASDSAFKAQVLASLMTHHASYYDVSVPSQPATSG